jgi:hypothetical protein
LTIEWQNGRTVKGIVEDRLECRNQTHDMDGAEKAVQDLLHKGIEKLTTRIKEEINEVKESQAPKHLESKAREQLEEVVTSHTKKVFVNCKG